MSPTYRRHRHSVSQPRAHPVFVTKYRRQVLNAAMLAHCETIARDVCARLGTELAEAGGEADHVHLLVAYPPSVPISQLAHWLKGTTARLLRDELTGETNRARMHGHLWSPSYCAVSCGGAPLSIIRQYIQTQQRPA